MPKDAPEATQIDNVGASGRIFEILESFRKKWIFDDFWFEVQKERRFGGSEKEDREEEGLEERRSLYTQTRWVGGLIDIEKRNNYICAYSYRPISILNSFLFIHT